eukprot:TRINITY_DN80334_c0_g1_i1.p1 TRINITY_DN80334_c0_g1~~TRINITY_DN80334_c0_g1_i1.p1  ORF type:complete len:547 (+),score=96.53 TRINITY_DN80334_c0_g1_i1:40-1680(+)
MTASCDTLRHLLQQVRQLCRQQQLPSAVVLGGIAVSATASLARAQPALAGLFIDALLVHGDALLGNNEPQRALMQYKAALSEVSSARLGESEGHEVPIRVKIAEAYLKLNDHVHALEHLERIDTSAAGAGGDNDGLVPILMMKARCYKKRGSRDFAAECFKIALKINPFIVEAIQGLLEVTDPKNCEQHVIAPLKRMHATPPQDKLMCKYLDLLKEKAVANYTSQLQLSQELLADYGGAVTPWLLDAAEANYRLANFQESVSGFHRVRELDPFNVERMDLFGSILSQHGTTADLTRLTNSLLSANKEAAETWVASALLMQKKDDPEKAHQFVNKAIENSPWHARAHLLKASLLKSEKKYVLAAKCYRRAYQLSKDLSIYQLLVESYLYTNQGMEAKLTAKEALEQYPEHPKALSLMGNVYYHMKMFNQARREYTRALAIQPECLEAVLSMVELDCLQSKLSPAIKRLKRLVPKHRFLHSRLADLYTQKQEFGDASYHYNAALGDNPSDAAAIEGLKRLEKLRQGGDVSDDEDHSPTVEEVDGLLDD